MGILAPLLAAALASALAALWATRLRAQERELQHLWRVSRELLCKLTPAGVFLQVSPSFTEVLGWTPTELVGRACQEFVHAEDVAALTAHFASLVRHEGVEELVNRWRCKDGRYRLICWRGFCPQAGGICYGSGRDISEESARAQARERALAFEKRLIGIVSHDLRNPLAAIDLAAQRLLRTANQAAALPAHRQQALVQQAGRIRDNCRRSERLIHDMLDFSQVRHTGTLQLRKSPLALAALVHQVVGETAALYPKRRILVDVPAHCTLSADAERLRQLLGNLLTNALKYGDETPTRVRLTQQAAQLTLVVQNGGAPIAKDILPHLFEPFWQGSTGAGPEKEPAMGRHSVGLGLYIVQEVARAHGGSVTVSSNAQQGTRFVVSLPTVAADGDAAALLGPPTRDPAQRPRAAAGPL